MDMNTENIREKASKKMSDLEGREGKVTKGLERVTSVLPSSAWLLAAGASIIGSLTLKFMGRDTTANFVGQWAPTFLIIGLYNKLVKVEGSERYEAR